MRKREFDETRKKPTAELLHELDKFLARERSLKTAIATGKVKSLKEVHSVQKSIAQLKTVLREREGK